MGVARALGAAKTAVVAHTIQLQEQYLKSFPELRTVRGRGNFPCLIEETTAESAPCVVAGTTGCPKYNDCEYHRQLREGISAPISVHNYAYWLPSANYQRRFSDLDLLFFDEAHILEKAALLDFVKIDLSNRLTRLAGVDFPDHKTDVRKWRAWAYKVVAKLKDEANLAYGFDRLPPSEVERIKAIKTLYERARLLMDLDEDWIIQKDVVRGNYSFEPVWVNRFGPKYILGHAKKTVFLSATILSKDLFLGPLGIDPESADFFRMRSTFPKENRPVIIAPTVKVRRGMSDEERAALVAKVDVIIDTHPGQNGLIHTTNYEIARLLMTMSRHKDKMLTHDSYNRTKVLTEFKESRGKVLVSPSMVAGVDLPDDECRFVIWAKLPFPDQGNERVKRRMKKGPDGQTNKKGESWSLWSVACDLVQGSGRLVRHKTDYGTVCIIDANIEWFLRAVGGISTTRETLLPNWYKEAMVYEKKEYVKQAVSELADYEKSLEVTT